MSGQHTQGRLVAYGLVIRGDENTSEDQVASATYSTEDARRLAACWNACEHLSTEALEELGPMAAALCSGDQQAIAERDQLRAELEQVRSQLAHEVGVLGVALDQSRTHLDQRNEARALLADVLAGAPHLNVDMQCRIMKLLATDTDTCDGGAHAA